MKTKPKITMGLIERQIESLTFMAEEFRDGVISETVFQNAIDDTVHLFTRGMKAGLYCSEQRLRDKFKALDNITALLIAEKRI